MPSRRGRAPVATMTVLVSKTFIACVKFLHTALDLNLVDLGVLVASTEAGSLLTKIIHHHEAVDSLGETWEVLYLRSGRKLATRL